MTDQTDPTDDLLDASLDRIRQDNARGIDVEAALAAVRLRMRSESDLLFLHPERRRAWRPQWIAVAAAVVLLLGGALVWRNMSRGVAALNYATAFGQSRDVTLSDGSQVKLGPASTLVVAAGYGRSSREMELDGIASFEVRHDAAHPFIVHAGHASVEDIGTVFAVRTDNAGGVAVVVTQGSVKLRSTALRADPGVLLLQGDRGVVTSAAAVAQPGTATAADVAWTRGGLAFEDAPLDRVRDDLRRWYGVEVVLNDSTMATRHLTATFDNESFDQVLRIMALALDTNVTRRGDTVFVGTAR